MRLGIQKKDKGGEICASENGARRGECEQYFLVYLRVKIEVRKHM